MGGIVGLVSSSATELQATAQQMTSTATETASQSTTVAAAAVLVLATLPVFFRLGSEFMPPLWEGSLLYMPVLLPSTSLTEVQRVMAWQDRVIAATPEVASVGGKLGRAETATAASRRIAARAVGRQAW